MDKKQLNEILLKIWNEKQDHLLLELFAPECILHSSIGSFQSAKEMQAIVKMWLQAFPDLHIQHIQILQDQETYIVQWQAHGTHLGEFEGIAPTKRVVHYKGCSLYKFSKKQVVEYWAYVDRYHLEKQLTL